MIKELVAIGMLLVLASASNAGVYTCEVDGKKVYQGVPCKNADSGTDRRMDSRRTKQTSELNDPQSSLTTKMYAASNIIHEMSIFGAECATFIKINPDNYMNRCKQFMDHQEDYGKAITVLNWFTKNEPEFVRANIKTFQSTAESVKSVNEYLNAIKAQLNM